MAERTPSSVRSFDILGAEFHLPKVAVPKHKKSPIMTEARDKAVLEALQREKRDAISERAKEEAARIMAEHERRMGR